MMRTLGCLRNDGTQLGKGREYRGRMRKRRRPRSTAQAFKVKVTQRQAPRAPSTETPAMHTNFTRNVNADLPPTWL